MPKTKNNKCPVGGKFAIDCDKYELCDDCPVYDSCSDEWERLRKEAEAQECPSGGKFGVDCDRYENCDNCQIYDACANEQERLGLEPEPEAAPEPEESKFIKGWDKWLEAVKERHCKGVINDDCKDCKYFEECFPQFKKVVQVPFYLVEDKLMKLTATQLKLFLFLAYRADFSPKSTNYGRCSKVSNDKIAKATGISLTNINKYFAPLEKAGLIKRTFVRRKDGDETFHTVRTVHVVFYQTKKKLKKWKASWDKLEEVTRYTSIKEVSNN